MTVYSVGHKNPDTDSVVSAIAAADLFSKWRKMECQPVVQGKINPETEFVLGKFGLAAPEIMESAKGEKAIIVDTTEASQLFDDLKSGEVLIVVDHHKLGDLTTSLPLEMWVRPVGCTSTILTEMYNLAGIEIPGPLAGAMLCAILSDTVMFKSPTCTDTDKKACAQLAKAAGIEDTTSLGIEMFKVKSAVSGTSAADLMFRDYKDMTINGLKIGVAQIEVIDLSVLEPVKTALYEECRKAKAEGRHSVFLLLTDIMKEGSEMLFVSDDPDLVKKAFGVVPKNNSVWLPGVLSRKKQVVPLLEKALA